MTRPLLGDDGLSYMSLPRLSGPRRLVDVPLTADDWKRVYWAYQGFMMQVRCIAKEAWERERKEQEAQR